MVASLLVSLWVQSSSAAEVTRRVLIQGPTIVAFAPPSVETATDEGAAEAIAHLQFALDDVSKCASSKHVKIKVVFVYADAIEMRDSGTTRALAVNRLGQGIGGVLVAPGRQAHVVASREGPSMLQELLPEAVSAYWGIEACHGAVR
ncbi:hypothetical protein [Stenotrophomonas panacihumi]|uniref:hypothetical protein n=1 Tax=Stenotrophomonas panacihumi TaxID=676599 RepID=UPI0011B246E2|nr:hypothetical protein [Stenotrophomonas panacihumi]